MFKNTFFVLMIVSFFAVSHCVYAGLISHHTFDNNIDDLSGNNHHGTVSQGTLNYGTGVIGNAADFDGSTIVSLGKTIAQMGLGTEVSLNLWFYNRGSAKYFRIFSDHGNQNAPYTTFQTHGSTGKKGTSFYVYAGGKNRSSDIVDFVLNEWQMLTITYNNHQANVYKNGENISTYNIKSSIVNAGLFGFGNAPDNPLNNYFFNGLIDDARIYDNVLSQEEITALYHEPTLISEPGTVVLLGMGVLLFWKSNPKKPIALVNRRMAHPLQN